VDGAKANHEPTSVIYEARNVGPTGIQPAAFHEIQSGQGSNWANPQGHQDASPPPPISHEEECRLAEQKGYERGLQEARDASHAEHEQNLAEVKELVGKLETGFREAEGSLSKEAVLLAMQISEKVLRKSLGKDPAALAANVESFLGSADTSQPVRILCHPESTEALRDQMNRVAERLKIAEWVVEADHELQAGDLLVSFGPATIDARINHRLERIEQALYRELELESHEGNIQ
jgi:flagellar assembly protein FliH